MQIELESPDALEPRRQEVMERLFMDLQVAQFNKLYYQKRAKAVRRLIRGANIIAALSASAAFTELLKSGGAPWLLQTLMAVAAISAAVVPLLGLEHKHSELEQAALGHAIVKDRIWCLLRDLKLSAIESGHEAREHEIDAFRDALSALDEEPHASVKQSCWEEVERELPSGKAWTII